MNIKLHTQEIKTKGFYRIAEKFLLFIIFAFFSSCDKEHTKEYIVINTFNDSIHFEFVAMTKLDSIILPNNSEKQIYISHYFFGTVGVSDDRYNDGVSDFYIKTDTSLKAISEDKWKYEEINKYHAKYLLILDSASIK